MCKLMLIYIRQFVAPPPLLAIFNTEFIEKAAPKVNMRRNDVGGHNHTEETVMEYMLTAMLNNSVNNFEAYS